MLLGAGLILVGGALLYYGFKGKDPRTMFAVKPPAVQAPGGVSKPGASLGAPTR